MSHRQVLLHNIANWSSHPSENLLTLMCFVYKHFYIHKSKSFALPCWTVTAAKQRTSTAWAFNPNAISQLSCKTEPQSDGWLSLCPAWTDQPWGGTWATVLSRQREDGTQHLNYSSCRALNQLWQTQRNLELTENDMFWFGLICQDSSIWIH